MSIAKGESSPDQVQRLQAQVEQLQQQLQQQHQAERTHRAAEAFRKVLVQNIPLASIAWDADFRVREWNPQAERLFGYTRNEAISQPALELIVPRQEREITLKIFDGIISRRASFEGMINNLHKQGQPLVCQWYCAPLVDHDDQVIGVASLACDVTSQHRQKEQLRASESGLRLMHEQIPAVVWATDDQLQITSSTGAALSAIHLKPNQLVGLNLREYLQTDDPSDPALSAHFRALKGESVHYEYHWQECVFQAYLEPLRDKHGEIVGTIGTALDVTDRHRAELALREAHDYLERRVEQRTSQLAEANERLERDIQQREAVEARLRESEERFRAIVETVPIPVIIVDVNDGIIRFANRFAGELIAIDHRQLVGRSTLDLYNDPSEREKLLVQFQQEGSAGDYEIQARRPDGKVLWLNAWVQPITYQGEELALGVLVDATHRKEAEKSLQRERRLLKRLLDLQERDRQLIAYEIHDGLVQDMTAALMFLEAVNHVLGERSDPSVQENFTSALKSMRGSVDEARRLINGLRPPVLEDEGLVAAIENLAEELRTTVDLEIVFTHDVQFQRIAPALEMALYRIAQECLNNVWQHSGETKARVELMQKEDCISISVSDSGRGFDPQNVETKRYGLTGIRERARLLGGEANIDSDPKTGTRVSVQLPLEDVLLPDELD